MLCHIFFSVSNKRSRPHLKEWKERKEPNNTSKAKKISSLFFLVRFRVESHSFRLINFVEVQFNIIHNKNKPKTKKKQKTKVERNKERRERRRRRKNIVQIFPFGWCILGSFRYGLVEIWTRQRPTTAMIGWLSTMRRRFFCLSTRSEAHTNRHTHTLTCGTLPGVQSQSTGPSVALAFLAYPAAVSIQKISLEPNDL